MRTVLPTVLIALGLASTLGFGSAQAQEFPYAALANRASPSNSLAAPGSLAAPSGNSAQFAEFPRSAFPVGASPSVSGHAPSGNYVQFVEFPHSALPAGTSLSASVSGPMMSRHTVKEGRSVQRPHQVLGGAAG